MGEKFKAISSGIARGLFDAALIIGTALIVAITIGILRP